MEIMSQCKKKCSSLASLCKVQFLISFFWFSGWTEDFLTVFMRFTWLSRTNVVVSRSVLVNHSAAAHCSPYSCCFVWYGDDYRWKYSVICGRFFRTPWWNRHLRWKCSAWKQHVSEWFKTPIHSDGSTPSLWDFNQTLRWVLDFSRCG